MNVIVFGGSGFVGSHVVDALGEAGHSVTVFDLCESPFLGSKHRFIEGDILDPRGVAEAIEGQQVVYNFAGLADIDEAASKPVETMQTNLLGCLNLLEAARRADVERFAFASTIYVYSQAGGFYRVSKQACELVVEEYQRKYGLDYTVLRYGSLYGRRADERNSVYRYLKQALLDRKITAVGTGDEIREYIHVQDAARASVEILSEEFKNQHVILTGHHPTRFRDMLEMIREIVGKDVEIHIEPPSEDAEAGGHYGLTPYSFRPKIGMKLVSHYYLDVGQGLLDCLHEIHEAEHVEEGA